MKKRWMTVTAVVMATTFMICACGKQQEQTTTFTGKETEKPEYQGNLNAISPAAYNNVEGLNLEPGTYISIIGKMIHHPIGRMLKKVLCRPRTI